jgi:hypothetical protein
MLSLSDVLWEGGGLDIEVEIGELPNIRVVRQSLSYRKINHKYIAELEKEPRDINAMPLASHNESNNKSKEQQRKLDISESPKTPVCQPYFKRASSPGREEYSMST